MQRRTRSIVLSALALLCLLAGVAVVSPPSSSRASSAVTPRDAGANLVLPERYTDPDRGLLEVTPPAPLLRTVETPEESEETPEEG